MKKVHGKTIIKVTGRTVASEAVDFINCRRLLNPEQKITKSQASEAICDFCRQSKEGTVGGMIAEYVYGLSDAGLRDLETKIQKQHNENVRFTTTNTNPIASFEVWTDDSIEQIHYQEVFLF